jgi:hypothetical protein
VTVIIWVSHGVVASSCREPGVEASLLGDHVNDNSKRAPCLTKDKTNGN